MSSAARDAVRPGQRHFGMVRRLVGHGTSTSHSVRQKSPGIPAAKRLSDRRAIVGIVGVGALLVGCSNAGDSGPEPTVQPRADTTSTISDLLPGSLPTEASDQPTHQRPSSETHTTPPDDCAIGTGESLNQERTIAAFDSLVVEGPFEIVLTTGAPPTLELEAQPDVLDAIRSEISTTGGEPGDTQLTLAIDVPCLPDDGRPIARIGVPTIEGIDLSGTASLGSTATVSASPLTLRATDGSDIAMAAESEDVTVEAEGVSTIELNGQATRLHAALKDGSTLRARSLSTEHVTVNAVGASIADIANASPPAEGNAPRQQLDVVLTEGSELKAINIAAENLTLDLAGVSTVNMTGSADVMTATLRDGSQLRSSGLVAANATITAHGVSRAAVHTTGTLTVDLTDGSEVHYRGTPDIVDTDLDETSRVVSE